MADVNPVDLPPQAPEAEMAVLGAMLLEKDAVERALDILEDRDFYVEAHRRIFSAIKGLFEKGAAVDLRTVGEELKRLRWFDDVGGMEYIRDVVHKVETAAHVETYARIVKDKAVLRGLINASTTIIRDCHQEAKEPAVLLDEAQTAILKVSERQVTSEYVPAKDLVHQTIDSIEKAVKDKRRVTGIPSGLTELDHLTSGFQKSDLILIGARPSQGKTALGLNIASHIVVGKEPRPVLFFSLEMSKHQLMLRLLASDSGVKLSDLRTGFLPKHRWREITDAADKLYNAPLYINDTPGMTVLRIRSIARQLQAELLRKGQPPLGLIIVDYLQLIRDPGRRESRQQEVSDISRGLKFLARDLDLPVIALSQLSRRPEEKGRADQRPQLSDLRESGALEQDADLVIFIHRESNYKRNDPTVDERKAELIVAKQRQGPTDSVAVSFEREFTRFGNFASEAAPADVASSSFDAPFSHAS